MEENLYETASGPAPRPKFPRPKLPNYYGDIIRKFLLFAGLIMLVTMPLYNRFISISVFMLLFAVLLVTVVAGLTNPKQWWVMVLDMVVSVLGLMAFEYHAVRNYGDIPFFLFGIDQGLAIIFFFTLYFGTKTLRAELMGEEMSGKSIPTEKKEHKPAVPEHQYPGPDPRSLP